MALYVVRCNFTDAAEEAAWNNWYDNEHVHRLLALPGFSTVTRTRPSISIPV